MQDRQLYEQILGLQAPWYVQRVELQLGQESGAVHVYLEHPQDQLWPCPECRQQCVLYDHQPERRWRHLDTCQYQTILHAAPPRSDCPEHGPRVVKLPWAEPNSRFTALFERLAIDWLPMASQTAVARQLGLTWDEIHAIMERAVERGLKRRQAEPIQHIGIDEKAFRKGHRYLTLVNDLDRCRVLYVSADRKQSSLDDFWPTLTESQRGGIEAVAMEVFGAGSLVVEPCDKMNRIFQVGDEHAVAIWTRFEQLILLDLILVGRFDRFLVAKRHETAACVQPSGW